MRSPLGYGNSRDSDPKTAGLVDDAIYTLSRQALGGHLELVANFADHTLTVTTTEAA